MRGACVLRAERARQDGPTQHCTPCGLAECYPFEVLESFSAGLFGISDTEASRMDPTQRLLVEVSYEALMDAGHTLEGLRGQQKGVCLLDLRVQMRRTTRQKRRLITITAPRVHRSRRCGDHGDSPGAAARRGAAQRLAGDALNEEVVASMGGPWHLLSDGRAALASP
jgi:hypothetical protein